MEPARVLLSTDTEEALTIDGRAPTLLSGILLVGLVLASLVIAGIAIDILLPTPALPAGAREFGFLLLGSSLALEAWATRELWNAGGTPNPMRPPATVVDSGPYRLGRNPLYVARVGILIGAGLALRSTGVVAVAGVLVLALHFMLVPREEQRLAERFGSRFTQYQTRVGRWFGRKERL